VKSLADCVGEKRLREVADMALSHVGRRPVPTQELARLLDFQTAVGMEVMVAALMLDRRFRFCKGEG